MDQTISLDPAGSAERRASGRRMKAQPQSRRTTEAERGIAHDRPFCLSERHAQILQLAARGLLDREIGDEVGLAPQTVRHYLTAIRSRLNARNTAHAVAIALTEQIITLEE